MGMILPDLKTEFLNSSRFDPRDVHRVLTPNSISTRFVPPGKPLILGHVPELVMPHLLPEESLGSGGIEPAFTDSLRQRVESGDKADLEFLKNRLLYDFYRQIIACIPPDQIHTTVIAFHDKWFAYGEGMSSAIPHMDTEDSNYSFTMTAAFPNASIFYPDFSPGELVALKKADRMQDFNATEHHGAPGQINLWNDHRAPHRGPRNDKTYEEWREILKEYEGIDKILRPDGSIRRIFMRATLELKEDWVNNVLAATAQPAFSL